MAEPTKLNLENGEQITARMLFADQMNNGMIRLKVEHEGTERYVWIPLGAALAAKDAGFLLEPQKKQWEVARKDWVTITRTMENGAGRTTLAWTGREGPPDQAPAPASPPAAAAPAQERNPPIPGVKGHPAGCFCGDCADERRIAAEESAKGEATKAEKAGRGQWLQLDRSYAAALAMATYHQCTMVGVYKTGDIDLVAAQAGCATVLIHMQKTGMVLATPAIRNGLQKRLEKQLSAGAPPDTSQPAPFPGDESEEASKDVGGPDGEPVPAGAPADGPDDDDDDLPF